MYGGTENNNNASGNEVRKECKVQKYSWHTNIMSSGLNLSYLYYLFFPIYFFGYSSLLRTF